MSNSVYIDHGTPKRQFSVVSDDAVLVNRILTWLVRRQKRKGYWGEKTELGRIVSTCQTVMTLIAYHYPTGVPPVKQALSWLKSAEVADSEYGFWRVSPFLAAEEAAEVVVPAVERIAALYKGGHQFNPNFLFPLYYHSLLRLTGADRQASSLSEVEDTLMKGFCKDTCWINRADSTSWAYYSLENARSPLLTDCVRNACASFLKQRATTVGGHAYWEGSIVATAYVVINVMSCSLRGDPHLWQICQKATSWLLSKAKENEPPHWSEKRENLPAGGEVYDAEFVTAVALRAIAAGRSWPEQAHVSQTWLAERARLLAQVRHLRIICAALASVAFYILAIPHLWGAYKRGALTGVWEVIASLIASVITLADLYGVYKLIREKLSPT